MAYEVEKVDDLSERDSSQDLAEEGLPVVIESPRKKRQTQGTRKAGLEETESAEENAELEAETALVRLIR